MGVKTGKYYSVNVPLEQVSYASTALFLSLVNQTRGGQDGEILQCERAFGAGRSVVRRWLLVVVGRWLLRIDRPIPVACDL